MALTGKITSQLSWTQYQTSTFGVYSSVNLENTVLSLGGGSGVGQINTLWYNTLQGNQNLDLRALPQNVFNGQISTSFANGDIKGIVVKILDSGNSGTLTLPFVASQGSIILGPSGTTVLGSSDGWSVTPGDIINLSLSAGTDYQITILGVSGALAEGLFGSIDSSSTLEGVLGRNISLNGSFGGTGLFNGNIASISVLDGTIDSVSVWSGDISVTSVDLLAGSIDGVAVLSGELSVSGVASQAHTALSIFGIPGTRVFEAVSSPWGGSIDGSISAITILSGDLDVSTQFVATSGNAMA